MSNATDFLYSAAATMEERGKTYDRQGGAERSMARTVDAFNAITGRDLTESEGWLLMLLLKQVRQWSSPGYHADSAVDSVAYAALLSESLSRRTDDVALSKSFGDDSAIDSAAYGAQLFESLSRRADGVVGPPPAESGVITLTGLFTRDASPGSSSA